MKSADSNQLTARVNYNIFNIFFPGRHLQALAIEGQPAPFALQIWQLLSYR
jgi:hypothetical protein